MKKLLVAVLALGLVISFSTCVLAQEKAKAAAPAAQQEEVKTIFSYKKELGLADKQEEDLKKIINDFQQYLTDKRQELNGLRDDLNKMMTNKESLKAIRGKLEQIAKIQVDISYTDIETARKTEGVLSAKQLDDWRKIQEDARAKMMEEQKKAAAAPATPAAKK